MENFFSSLNTSSFVDFVTRSAFNFAVIYIIARLIYFKLTRKRDYLFTLLIFNLLIFFVCYLLNSIKLSLGFAFGIFAIFSILRYRTETVPIKEMTYMFISISVAIINALTNPSDGLLELVFTNVTIVAVTIILEKTWVRNVSSKNILYERIENIKPENHELLLEDLRERTGLDIHRFEIGSIDFLKDIAKIKVYYFETKTEDKSK